MINPELDGIEHINIYSRGRTELGRLMSNFAYSPFVHPRFGQFNSVEGLWYWLSVQDSPEAEELRELHGYAAKKLGRELRGADWSPEESLFLDFRQEIRTAISVKVAANLTLIRLLEESTLPFVHYYIIHDKVIDRTEEESWIIEHWNDLRANLQIL